MVANWLQKGYQRRSQRVVGVICRSHRRNAAQARKMQLWGGRGTAETCTDEKRKAAQWEILICLQSSFSGRIGNVDLCD